MGPTGLWDRKELGCAALAGSQISGPLTAHAGLIPPNTPLPTSMLKRFYVCLFDKVYILNLVFSMALKILSPSLCIIVETLDRGGARNEVERKGR